MFNRSVQKTKPREVVSNARPVKPPVGRERLQHFDDQIGLAKQAIAEIEERISRFEGIITDADGAHKALQAAIESDNGKALADYSSGNVPADSTIARLVMVEHNSARAATAAKASLPTAHAQLENARGQLHDLGEQRVAELNRTLSLLGDVQARAYRDAFESMCLLHDQLAGFASVAQASHGDIQLIIDPVKTPRFAFPSLGNADADPFLRHQVSSHTVTESARAWSAVRARLEADALADVSDLI
jgi:hypothetical protein